MYTIIQEIQKINVFKIIICFFVGHKSAIFMRSIYADKIQDEYIGCDRCKCRLKEIGE